MLDFATRSGDWAHDFYRSEQHSKAKITAMDPIYMQRFEGRKFLHHTLEGDWPFSAKRAFHFIHAESLGGVVVDFEGFHSNSYKHLVPGRWLEVRENDIRPFCSDDDDHHDGGEVLGLQAPALKQWQELLAQAAEKFGKRINVAWMQRELMERAGFIKVKEQVFKVGSVLFSLKMHFLVFHTEPYLQVPLGEWSENPKWKSIGRHYWYQFSRALEGYSLPLFTGTLGWSKEDTDAFLARVREELQQQKDNLRLYSYFHVVAGQKPVNNAGR